MGVSEIENNSVREFPRVESLHERHFGLTKQICAHYAQAASVCMSRHHDPPAVIRVSEGENDQSFVAHWSAATVRDRGAWANDNDATEVGAYGFALGAAEAFLGLVAVRRAEGGTGADYYVAPHGAGDYPSDEMLDLEEAVRLEVSGIDRSKHEHVILGRLRQKVEQTRRGQSNLPAISGVVAFDLRRIIFQKAE